MSSCPNCGSALWVDHGDVHDEREGLWQRTWICCSTQIEGFPLSVKPGCVLIRSLREELRVANATLKEHELVCYGAMERGRDAERDRIADWLEHLCDYITRKDVNGKPYTCFGYMPCTACDDGRSFCDHKDRAAALRANEHRSDT